ncbi:MAG: TetR/AcrR family transcriptional regulator [Faecalimonas sp.]|nr:TetR/AcrR family transcriptional regulator [Faecalimonas sp.]
MQEAITLSKQQKKSKETKERIFHAAKRILQRSGYEALSIKNICEEAGVSNGSFYHHFQTKDDLLSYYIEDQPRMNPDLLELPKNPEEAKNAIVSVYLNYANYCRALGVDFIAGYYTPRNQALNPTIRTERPYPIVTVQCYLEKAVASGAIKLKLSIEEVVTDIRMLVIGNAFEWAMRNGDADLDGNIKRSISHYLDGVFVKTGHP